jgi:hypothetical protein
MAERFVLTAEIQLRAPTNTAQVRDEIQRQLDGVTLDVKVKGAPQSARALSQVEKKVDSLTTASERMGNSFGLSLKRFAAFSIANRAVGLFTSKTAAAINEAIDFETELIKVVQVTGKTKKELTGLTDTITKLSTALIGTSSKGLLSTARILSQAGIAAGELDVALTALAKTTLAPTFDDIEQTAEGAVAVLAQFGEGVGALERQLGAVNAVAGQFAVESGDLISAVRRTGGVFKSAGGDLNELLALFTSVRATTRESAESIATGLRTIFTRIQRPQTIEYMKQFGVELTDLEGRFVGPFEAVRQLSGALSSFEEGDIRFVKIAEELGGFRQIGKVLPLIQKFEIAEKARQAALDGGNSLTEDTIVAQQGLAVQFTKVREEFLALARSMTETGAFRTMVQTLLSLSSSLISLSESFKPIMPILVGLAGIKIARGLGGFAAGVGSGLARKSEGGPIGFATGGLVPGQGSGDTVPAMLTPGEFVMKKSSVEGIGVDNLARLNSGGPVQRYAPRGGRVLIKDQVEDTPAEQPDILVIPDFINPDQTSRKGQTKDMTLKAAVDMVNSRGSTASGTLKTSHISSGFGSNVLVQLKSAAAAQIAKNVDIEPESPSSEDDSKDDSKKMVRYKTNPGAIGGFFLNPAKGTATTRKTSKDRNFQITEGDYAGHPGRLVKGSTLEGFSPAVKDQKANPSLSETVEIAVSDMMEEGMLKLVPAFDKHVSVGKLDGKEKAIADAAKKIGKDPNVVNTTTGFMFEGVIQALTGAQFSGNKANFDFNEESLTVNRSRLSELFGSSDVNDLVKADAKKNAAAGNDIFKKVVNDISEGNENGVRITRLSGGGPSDTVDALLTPGEWVVPKDVAERVGYGNLDRMNKSGVKGFAKGGIVGPQKFASGSGPKGVQPASDGNGGGGEALAGLFALQAVPGIIQSMVKSEGEQTTAIERVVTSITDMISTVGAVTFALQAFGISLNKESAKRALSLGGIGEGGLGNTIKTQFSKIGTKLVASLDKVKRFESVNESRVARGAKPFDLSEKLSGRTRFEAGLTRASGKVKGALSPISRSFSGADRLLGKPIGKLAGLFGRLGGGLLKFSGPIGIAATVAGGFSSVLSAYQDNLGKYNDAVKEGNVAKAQELAVNKNVSGFANLFDDVFGEGGVAFEQEVREWFGGDTTNQLVALATASARASKFQSEFADNSKKAARIMQDIAAERVTAAFALSDNKVTKNFENTTTKRLDNEVLNKANKDDRSSATNFDNNARNFFSFFGANNVDQENARVEDENKTRTDANNVENDKEFEALGPVFRQLTSEMTLSERGINGFNAALADSELDLTADQLKTVREDYKNQSQAIRENIAYVKAMNFGLRDIIAASQNAALQMQSVASASVVGSNSVDQEIANIKGALSTLSSVMSPGQIGEARSAIESSFTESGADPALAKKTLGNFDFISGLGKDAGKALAGLKKKQSVGTGAQELKDFFVDQLSEGKTVEESSRIEASARKLDLSSPEIAAAIKNNNVEAFGDIIQKDLATQFAKDLIAIKEAEKQQSAVLIGLTKRKIDLQNKELDAIQQSVRIRLEAATTFAEFDGNRVQSNTKKGLLATGVNASLNSAGVGGLNPNASAGRIGAAFKDIRDQRSAITDKDEDSITKSGRSSFQDSKGLDTNKLDELNRANKDLLQYTRDRIGIVRDELALARKKTDLERSSVEKLLDGDFLGFMEGQQTADAAKALAAGDSGAASQFTPKQLGEAFRSLRDQGLESGKLAKAAQIALGPFSSQRNVDLLVGTTDEEKPFISEGKELSRVMIEAGKNLVDFAKRDITVHEAVITVTNQKRDANRKVIADQTRRVQSRDQIAEAEQNVRDHRDSQIFKNQQSRKQRAQEARDEKERLRVEAIQQQSSLAVRAVDQRKYGTGASVLYPEPISDGLSNGLADISRRHGLAQGGTVYANTGMFVPRGTDTVPAMLTPGEFVVNRRSVQRGNNLQMLQAMNGGDGVSYGRGGVSYRKHGGRHRRGGSETGSNVSSPSVSIDTSELITSLNNSFTTFQASVDQLSKIKVKIAFDTTNVNVTLTESSFVASMKKDVKNEIMELVVKKVRTMKHATNGTHEIA